MRVFARQKLDNAYLNVNIATAAQGFHELGVEIIHYKDLMSIYSEFERTDILLDGIYQCNYLFDKFTQHPELCDYPEILLPYMGRNVWTDSINHINCTPELWNVFVKPIQHKAFTGRAVRGPADLIGCGNQATDLEVLCTDLLDIKREFRAFILYDKVIDIRPYKGDWHYNYNPAIIDRCVEAFSLWEGRPVACSLDFAVVIKDGREQTVFLEQNDAYALGCYGLFSTNYAKLISARWAQVMGTEDEFKGLQCFI